MANDRSRPLWLLCVLFGAGVIAFAIWFGGVIPAKTCTGPLPRGVSALLAYQMARTPSEVEAVFGPTGNPCRAGMIAAMDLANTVDLISFIATYGLFLAFFFLAMQRTGAGAAARIGLMAVGAAAAFDVIETAAQLRITGELPGSTEMLALLAIGSRGKYLALAAVCASGGLAMWVRGSVLGRVAGILCAASGVLVVAGLVSAQNRALLSLGNSVAWTLILLYAAQAAMRRKPAASHR